MSVCVAKPLASSAVCHSAAANPNNNLACKLDWQKQALCTLYTYVIRSGNHQNNFVDTDGNRTRESGCRQMHGSSPISPLLHSFIVRR